jgi:transcriptional regulator with XRE-family HTH domain
LERGTIVKYNVKAIIAVFHSEVLKRFICKPRTAKQAEFDNELKAVTKLQISKIENGKFNSTIATVNKISSALGA